MSRGALVLVIVATSAARAQPVDTDVQAKVDASYAEGMRRYDAGDYIGAAAKFEAGYQIDHDPASLFNIAQAYRFAKLCGKAKDYYQQFLSAVPKPPNVADIQRYIVEMESCMQPAERVGTPPPKHVDTPQANRSDDVDGDLWWRAIRDAPIMIALGAQGGVASDLRASPAMRVGLRSRTPSGASIVVEVGSGSGMNFRETTGLVLGGWRLGSGRGAFEGFVGVQAGGGAFVQTVNGGSTGYTWAAAASPWVGGSVRVTESLSIMLDGEVRGALLEADGKMQGVLLPAGWLGVVWNH